MSLEETERPLKLQRPPTPTVIEDGELDKDEPSETKLPSHTLVFCDPIETPDQLEHLVDSRVPLYGQFFKTREDLTEFMMLPINEVQRKELLVEMSQDIQARRTAGTSSRLAKTKRDDNTSQ